LLQPNSNSKDHGATKSITTTPDFSSMIRITFWNGLGFIFFMFIKSYVVIYFFGGSGFELGIIMALQPFARLISMPLIAYLTDHTSKKRLVLIGSMGRTISYFIFWLSLVIHNLFLFGVGTFLQGLLVAFFWPPFYSLISQKSSKNNRTQALATGRGNMIGYGFLMGAIISIPIFALVSIFLPDNIPLMYSPLLIFSIINLIAGHRFYTKIDENLTFENYLASLNDSNLEFVETGDNGTTNGELNKKKPDKIFYIAFLVLIIAILATSIAGTIYSPFISAYLIETLLIDLPENIIPIIVMIVYFPAQVLSQLISPRLGKVFDRISPTISFIVVNLFKALMIWFLIGAFTSLDFAIILILLYIALESNTYFIQAIMSRVSIKHRGKIFGLNIWIDRLGRVIGPIIGGILWVTLPYNTPFILSIFIGLCLIPIFIFSTRKLNPYMIEQVEIFK
jgi:MFS family permease